MCLVSKRVHCDSPLITADSIFQHKLRLQYLFDMSYDPVHRNEVHFSVHPLDVSFSEANLYEQADTANTSEPSTSYNASIVSSTGRMIPITPPINRDTSQSCLDDASTFLGHKTNSGSQATHMFTDYRQPIQEQSHASLPAAATYMKTAEDLYVICEHLRSLAEHGEWEEMDRLVTKFQTIGNLWRCLPQVSLCYAMPSGRDLRHKNGLKDSS